MAKGTSRRNDDTPGAAVLIRILTDSYQGPAWHGASVRFIVRGIEPAQTGARLGRGRPSIHEQLLHICYARHRVLFRLRPESRIPFPRKMRNSWWPIPADASPESWKSDIELLDDYQKLLLAAIAEATQKELDEIRPGARHSMGQELLGVALHDAYHSAQIRLTQLASGKA